MDEREGRELRERLERLKSGGSADAQPQHPKGWQQKMGEILNNRYVVISLLVFILVLNVGLRLGLANYAGFFEPDGFFHYSVILQAIQNHYVVPLYSDLSGFPLHNEITEPGGLYYVTLIPYFFLRFFGVSVYTVMRYIPVVFGMLDALGVYLLAKYMSGSRSAGLLAAFFISISSGDISRTAALVYRGDTFATIFVIIALVLFVKVLTSKRRKLLVYGMAALSGIILATAEAVWGGAPFGVLLYIIAVAVLAIYGFIKGDEKLCEGGVVLSLALLVSYLVQALYLATGVLRYVPSLGGSSFFVFFVPLMAGSLLSLIVIKRKDKLSSIAGSPGRRALFSALLLIIAIVAILVAFPGYLGSLSGSGGAGSGNLGITIQELQKPTFSFIWASFSWQIVLAPIAVILFLALRRWITEREKMRVANIAFIAIASYFLVTFYLQLNAIRYNSLVSAPIAVFAGYAVYSVIKLVGYKTSGRGFVSYLAIGVVVAVFAAAMVLNTHSTYNNSFTSGQADGINPQFLTAMAWLRNNTPSNATVLALWPDGSVVEGFGDRQSLMDSVGGQTESRIYNFSRWLFSTTPNATYLYDSGEPQYFVVRGYWLAELGGIATEGNITNTSAYGYDAMTSLKLQHTSNSTLYLFNSSSYPYYSVELIETQGQNNTANFVGYLGSVGSPQRVPLSSVIFINDSGGRYSVVPSDINSSAGYSFVVDFQGTNITGGSLLGALLPFSNFFRFTALCNYADCPYNDSGVTMNVIYQNQDTKIIKISYPSPSSSP
ncbi:MAG TPA: STT3 domain-containing protein [Candidatus Acidoferrum sp.]|nr:STT3 domain-containing protein [Candidatus Acidoferrum sp.]